MINTFLKYLGIKKESKTPLEQKVDFNFNYHNAQYNELVNIIQQLEMAILTINNEAIQTLAFPTAKGFGKNATGGRGGTVIKVTNLNDTGAGSLRNALSATGNRTVIFEVGGTINLSGNIDIPFGSGNVTVLGQTAPGDGICIRGGMLTAADGEVIIRYIRIRPGSTAPTGADGAAVSSFLDRVIENVIFDHCSISWADDENVNVRTAGTGAAIARNVTFQNCILSENLYAVLIDGSAYNVTFYNNLVALHQERHIRSSGYTANTLCSESINNLFYGYKYAHGQSRGVKSTAIGNHFKLSSQVTVVAFETFSLSNDTATGSTIAETEIYLEDNIIPVGRTLTNAAFNPYVVNTPFDSSGIIPVPAVNVAANILGDVGCSFPTRDAIDTTIVNNWINGDGTHSWTETYPTLSSGTPLTDTNNDGIPDNWEGTVIGGIAFNSSTMDSTDISPSGYAWIEEYANELVGE